MSWPWVVVLRTGIGSEKLRVYGPFTDEDEANAFTKFMTSEVDPAKPYRLYGPADELLGWYQNHRLSSFEHVEFWPPLHGDIWQDRDGNRWACQAKTGSYLCCLARPADDGAVAEDVFRRHGPMTLVYRPDPVEEECPF